MKKIGCFRQDGENFSGNITTLQFSVQARLTPALHKRVASDADYILTQTKTGFYAPEIGSAWKRANADGVAYLTVEIDDPTCRHPIAATLWQAEDGLWYLFWNRGSGSGDAEKLLIQEELKPPMAWHRAPQKMTAYLQELFPQLVL
ncbi:MAG: DUF736 domain-containing protein [Alphaproteobacteria bacterium]|nr:DUF736 domain-containing protein [Alphaproteobacteria bacterium]